MQGHDIEIQAADGTWFGLSLVPTFDRAGNQEPRRFADILVASDADAPLSESLESDIQESWFRGVGLDYDWAPGVDTRDPEYACPAGAATDVTIPATSAGAIVAMEEYGADLFLAQIGDGTANTGRVLRLTGGVAPLSASLALGAGEYMRGLCLGDDGSGNTRLYAFSSDGGTQSGRVHEWNGAAWTSTAAATFGTNGRGPTRKVTWRGRDGIKNNALVTKSGPKKISYTRPNSDPKLAASWVEGVPIGTGYDLIELAAARGHIFFSARDNLFDLDEVGNTPGITSFIEEQVQVGNGDAVMYLDGSVYYSMGRGLLKIDVNEAGAIQEIPGQCAPGAFLPVEGCPRGYITAMCPDQSWIVASVFETTTRTSNVFWGKPREHLGIDSPNPLIWHGPLLRYESDYRVTKLRTSALSGGLRLWIASIGDTSGTPTRLSWMSLPLAGTTLQDQVAGGSHRVTTGSAGGTLQPYARLYSLKKTAGDKASRKDLQAHVVGTRGLDIPSGTKLTVYNRADAAPGSTSWGSGTDITAGPVQTVTPSAVTAGYSTEQRIDFFAPNGGATPPIIPYLDSIRNTFWRIAPDAQVRTVTVAYGDGVPNRAGTQDSTYDPDTISGWLAALMSNGTRTTARQPDVENRRWTVRVRQSFPRETTIGTGGRWGKSVTATLQLVKVAEL